MLIYLGNVFQSYSSEVSGPRLLPRIFSFLYVTGHVLLSMRTLQHTVSDSIYLRLREH